MNKKTDLFYLNSLDERYCQASKGKDWVLTKAPKKKKIFWSLFWYNISIPFSYLNSGFIFGHTMLYSSIFGSDTQIFEEKKVFVWVENILLIWFDADIAKYTYYMCVNANILTGIWYQIISINVTQIK